MPSPRLQLELSGERSRRWYSPALGGLTYEEVTWHCRRVEQAERRYLRAIRELAQVRKIQQVTVQVNVGEQQIIIAGG